MAERAPAAWEVMTDAPLEGSLTAVFTRKALVLRKVGHVAGVKTVDVLAVRQEDVGKLWAMLRAVFGEVPPGRL